MNLHIKNYDSNDEYKILELFKNVFNREMYIDYWKWRYEKNKNKYIRLMLDEEKVVGHYALFPIEILYNNESINTGFSMTTMTANDYNGMGIFRKLADDLYKDQFNNLKIIWGFPNNNSFHGFIKYLNWKHIYNINMLTIDIRKNIHSIKKNNKNIIVSEKFSFQYNKLCFEISNQFKIMTKRDEDYLNWRFLKNPLNKYTILEYRDKNILKGYCIFKMFKSEEGYFGDIVDILAYDKYVFQELIEEAILKIYENNALYANTWMINYELKNVLYEIGFCDSNNFTHFAIRINSNQIDKSSFIDIKNWYITMADSDLF